MVFDVLFESAYMNSQRNIFLNCTYFFSFFLVAVRAHLSHIDVKKASSWCHTTANFILVECWIISTSAERKFIPFLICYVFTFYLNLCATDASTNFRQTNFEVAHYFSAWVYVMRVIIITISIYVMHMEYMYKCPLYMNELFIE